VLVRFPVELIVVIVVIVVVVPAELPVGCDRGLVSETNSVVAEGSGSLAWLEEPVDEAVPFSSAVS
jgi:hypothetical protein